MSQAEHFIENHEDLIKLFREVSFLEPFSENEIQALADISEIKHYKPGDLIISEDVNEGWSYYLISGKVKVHKHGKELQVLRRTGDVFGELGVLRGSSSTASVYAKSYTVCLALNIRNLNELSFQNILNFKNAIFREFACILATRLKEAGTEMLKLKSIIAEKTEQISRLEEKIRELTEQPAAL